VSVIAVAADDVVPLILQVDLLCALVLFFLHNI
jgi:hypothetical protein